LHVRSFFDETTARVVVAERQEKLLVQVEERDLSRVVSLEIEVLSRGNPHEVVAVRPGIEGEWGSTVWVGKDVDARTRRDVQVGEQGLACVRQ
jgi:hypothetical protein